MNTNAELTLGINDCFISSDYSYGIRILEKKDFKVLIDYCYKTLANTEPYLTITRFQIWVPQNDVKIMIGNTNYNKITLSKFNRVWNRKNYKKITFFSYDTCYVKFGEKI